MSDEEALNIAQRIATCFGLMAEFVPNAKSVGVGGDSRTYTRVICLTGAFPGHKILAQVSAEISNQTPVNRVIFEIAKKTKRLPVN